MGAVIAWFAGLQMLLIAALVQTRLTNTAKSRSTEARLADQIAATAPAVQLANNATTSGGSTTFTGDVHISGNLYGSGGTLNIGDTARFNATGNGPSGSNTFLGMTNSQASFLDTLSQMSAEGSQPLGTDGFGGGVWTSSQATSLQTLQGIVNDTVGAFNNLLSRLQSNGYMS